MSPELQGLAALVILFGLMMLFAAATRRWSANLRPLAAFDSLGKAIERAVRTYGDQDAWSGIVSRAMALDYSWRASAAKYADLYESATEAAFSRQP